VTRSISRALAATTLIAAVGIALAPIAGAAPNNAPPVESICDTLGNAFEYQVDQAWAADKAGNKAGVQRWLGLARNTIEDARLAGCDWVSGRTVPTITTGPLGTKAPTAGYAQ
jgi:hypothetical protein